MKFDQRFGLTFILRHLTHSNLIPNLFQISALVWSTQFSVNFFLCSDPNFRNEENLTTLEELFTEIESIYSEKNDMNQKRESAIKFNNQIIPIIQTIDHNESGKLFYFH